MKTPCTLLCTLILTGCGLLPADELPETEGQPNATVMSHVLKSASGTVYSSNQVVGSGNSVITELDSKNQVYIQSTSNGKGFQLIVIRDGQVLDPKRISYQGKANRFWSKKRYDQLLKKELYWCPKRSLWYEYDATTDQYRPSVAILKREMERKRQAAEQAMLEAEQQIVGQVDQTLQDVDQLMKSFGAF